MWHRGQFHDIEGVVLAQWHTRRYEVATKRLASRKPSRPAAARRSLRSKLRCRLARMCSAGELSHFAVFNGLGTAYILWAKMPAVAAASKSAALFGAACWTQLNNQQSAFENAILITPPLSHPQHTASPADPHQINPLESNCLLKSLASAIWGRLFAKPKTHKNNISLSNLTKSQKMGPWMSKASIFMTC